MYSLFRGNVSCFLGTYYTPTDRKVKGGLKKTFFGGRVVSLGSLCLFLDRWLNCASLVCHWRNAQRQPPGSWIGQVGQVGQVGLDLTLQKRKSPARSFRAFFGSVAQLRFACLPLAAQLRLPPAGKQEICFTLFWICRTL